MTQSIPPLVNAHTHLELSWAHALLPATSQPFHQWMSRFVRRSRLSRQTDNHETRLQKGIEQGIEQLLACGTTHVGDIANSGLSIEPLLDSGLAGVVYIEVLGLEEGVGDFMLARAQELLAKYRPQERNGLRIGLSAHAPYSTTAVTFQKVAQLCLAEEIPLCIHLAESPAEQELFATNGGPLAELPIELGGTVRPQVPAVSPVRYLADLGVLAAKPLLVHMVQVSADDLDLVAEAGATVAHCPRSNERLEAGRMPLEQMLARGIAVGLGTDSLASSPSLDVREEVDTAVAIHQERVARGVLEEMLSNTAVF